MKRHKNLEVPEYLSECSFNADVHVGHSIRIYGAKKSGTRRIDPAPDSDIGLLHAAAVAEGGYAWHELADYMEPRIDHEFRRNALVKACGRLSNPPADFDEPAIFGGRTHREIALSDVEDNIGVWKPLFRVFDKTFAIGDDAVCSAYNLVYTGSVERVTAKSVFIREPGREKRHRFTLATFCTWNWDYNADRINRRNSDVLMHI